MTLRGTDTDFCIIAGYAHQLWQDCSVAPSRSGSSFVEADEFEEREQSMSVSLTFRGSMGADIKWGLNWGLWLAVGFSLIGSVLFVLQGSAFGHPSRFSFPMVILGYFAMGAIGGLLIGVFRPLTQRRIGATILGIIIGIIVYAIAGLVAIGEKEFLTFPGLVSAVILGTVIGGACGHNTWTKRRNRQ